MHLETLLYMLLQSDQTRPPAMRPDFELLAKQAQKVAVPNEWIMVPYCTLSEGMNDPENDEGPDRYFGWDNEKPKRSIHVPAFEAQARPLTNEDYARFLDQTSQQKIPVSWISGKTKASQSNNREYANCDSTYMNGAGPRLTNAYLRDKSVRTVFGPVPLEHALDWPVFASYDELSACAAWMNGRIPTVEEARSIYHHVDINKNKHTDSIITKKVSAVNG
jgi:formylglycine-generating enzyme required for sulfatase activity